MELDFLAYGRYTALYSPSLKESLEYQRFMLLRVFRFLFSSCFFILKYTKDNIFMHYFKGFFSVFLFPIFFSVFLYLYKIKLYLMNRTLYAFV
jgi:hypothetical protein